MNRSVVSKIALAIAAFFLLIVTPNFAYAHDPNEEIAPVNSFEIFWPIVAGKVRGESLYFAKSLKEKIRGMLVFSTFKKADYNITLSVKRVVEAEKLLKEKKDLDNAKKTLDEAHARREAAWENITSSEQEGRYVVDLRNTLKSSLEKQRALLNYLASQAGEAEHQAIDENVSKINSLISKLE